MYLYAGDESDENPFEDDDNNEVSDDDDDDDDVSGVDDDSNASQDWLNMVHEIDQISLSSSSGNLSARSTFGSSSAAAPNLDSSNDRRVSNLSFWEPVSDRFVIMIYLK